MYVAFPNTAYFLDIIYYGIFFLDSDSSLPYIVLLNFSGKNQQHHTGCTETAFQKRAQQNIHTIKPAQ
jgi:hypothetical protein